eukprot:2426061-Pyramimonas_sp.AAC.1
MSLGPPGASRNLLSLPGASRSLLGLRGVSRGLLEPRVASWSLLGPPRRIRAPGEARSIGADVHKTLRIGAAGEGQSIGAHVKHQGFVPQGRPNLQEHM